MAKHTNKYKANSLNFFTPQRTIDFHDYSQLHPYDVEKLLTEFIEDCYVAGISQLLVITGKGRIVRPLAERLLKRSPHVAQFKPAGYFNGQGGAFEVELVVPLN
jgi:DNA-nicking Smr family endonuclease